MCSVIFLTFKESKNLSTIIQNFTVSAVYLEPEESEIFPTVSLKTFVARFTLITEYNTRFIWSLVSFLTNFKQQSKSS